MVVHRDDTDADYPDLIPLDDVDCWEEPQIDRYGLDISGLGADDTVRRDERVRAKRAGEWLGDPLRAIADLSIALSATSAPERYMCFLFQGQALSSWQGHYGIEAVPLIQYSRSTRSPSLRILDIILTSQQSSLADVCPVLAGRVYLLFQFPEKCFWNTALVLFYAVWW